MIVTKKLSPTTHLGARITATYGKTRKISVPYDHAIDSYNNHLAVARLLASGLGWSKIAGGETLNGWNWVKISEHNIEQV